MNNSIILFDGVCNLCNGSVRFIIKHDKNNKFKFAALQSVKAKELLHDHQLPENLKSLILIEGKKVYTQSTAVIRIAVQLGFWWKLFYVFYIFPPFIRNIVYRFVSATRYRFFGRQSICNIPAIEIQDRFLT